MARQAAAQKEPAPQEQASADKTVTLTKAQQKKVAELTTVSDRIRYLNAQGYSRSEITRAIPNAKGGKLLYQHVRNVLITPVGKAKS